MASPAPRRSAGRAAWAGDPPQRSAARERLLDAAARCVVRDGLPATGIAAVALEAGVSRPTVYRYFADREALVEETLLRAGRGLAGRLATHLRRFSDPGRQAIEAMLFALREIRRDPILRHVWSSTLLDASALEAITRPTTIAWTREALETLVASAGWSDAEADEALELMLRFLLALMTAPEPRRTPAALRAFLRRRLLPGLGLTAEPRT